MKLLPSVITSLSANYCGSGSVKITATPSSGATIDWYDSSTNGTLLHKGSNTYTTPSINTTTTYYAQARNTTTGCVSSLPRTPVTATANALPTVVASTSNSRCNTGTVVITATPSTGATIDWYSTSTGISPLQSGSTAYTTPSITAGNTNTYYAQARNTTTGCVSSSRTAVTATANANPTVATPTRTPADVICPGGNFTLSSPSINPGSGTIGSSSYQWKANGVNSCTTASCTISGAKEGTVTYTLTVKNSNDCSTTSSGLTVVVDAGKCVDTPAACEALRAGVIGNNNNNCVNFSPGRIGK